MCKVLTRWNTAPGFDRTPAPSHPTGISPVFACPSVSPKCTPVAGHQKKPKKKEGPRGEKPTQQEAQKKTKNKEHAVTANSLRGSSWPLRPCLPDISADHHASTGAPLPQHPFRSRSQCFTGTAVLSSIVPSFARSFDAADGILPHHLQFASSWHFASEVFRFKGQCSAHSQENPEPGLDRTPAPSHPTGLSPVLHALRYPRSVPRLKATKRSQKKKKCVASSSNVAFNLCFTQ